MDIDKIIRELQDERKKLDQIVESLEALQTSSEKPADGAGNRRGRRSMDPQARQEVSKRMKEYWAKKRTDKDI